MADRSVELESLDIAWPSPAGELHRAGKWAALAQELGSNYDRYHEHLKAIGYERPIPDPDRYRDRGIAGFDSYLTDFGRWQQVGRAEELLRLCRNELTARMPTAEDLRQRADEPPLLVGGAVHHVDVPIPDGSSVEDAGDLTFLPEPLRAAHREAAKRPPRDARWP